MPVKSRYRNRTRRSTLVGALVMVCSGLAQGADLSFEQEQELRSKIDEQTRRLDALRQQIVEADRKLAEIRNSLGIETLRSTRGGAGNPATGTMMQPIELAQAPSSSQTDAAIRPASATPASRPQQVAQIFEQPGVLTPRGKMVLEPGLQYGYSSSSRVSIVGYTIIPALTVGLIDVREVKRNTFTGSLTGRWGLTNRFEIEAKLPYVYRSDDVLARPLNSGSGRDELFSSTGNGIGDVEVTGRYQFNNGGIDKPYYIGTLRFKSRTGKDPFEVETDTTSSPHLISNEIQKELPTGSGFYTLQPGLTVLYPTDPAVFFGSINYQYNFKRSNVTMNTTQGSIDLGDVEPGDVIGFNFGMGLALNERSSFSIGYDHASVGKTKINGRTAINSVRTQLGTLLLGYSQRINSSTSLNVSVGAGVTRDTPDVTLSIRLPITF
jgi:hypothetical protein